MSDDHVVLLVEDEPEMAEELSELLESFGYTVLLATTQKQALALVDKSEFCLALLDLQIPVDPKRRAPPSTEAGRTLIERVRDRFPHRNERRKSCLPIVVLSGNAREHEDVMAAMDAGADDFLKKPLSSSKRALRDVLKTWLANSGRDSHARCAAVSSEARDGHRFVQLVLTGAPRGRRVEVEVNEKPVEMQVAVFTTLLRLAKAREASDEGSVPAAALGLNDSQALQAASRLRRELRSHVPGVSDPVPCVAKTYALSPAIRLAPVDWAALERHPDSDVRRLVAELKKALKPA